MTSRTVLHRTVAGRVASSGAVSRGAVLRGAVPRGAVLRGAVPRGAVLRGAVRAGPRCGICSAVISSRHRHLLDESRRALLCGCPACHASPADDRIRPVPDRYLEFPGDVPAQETWDDLRAPAGLALVTRTAESLVVCGPAPGGAAESELPGTVWDRLVARHPAFATLSPGVEALLMRRAGCFLVPIDACYELAGLLRTSWRGFDGGQGAQGSLTMFFARLRARCL
ncbi:DUF5947 family protein [Actinoplanes sp. NPDC023936]|uniref:DUF5947 family protein n=1 Tax=Actinoplanes sp. NPDC023936 TaxID=3154910 RepID=UPI003406A4B1